MSTTMGNLQICYIYDDNGCKKVYGSLFFISFLLAK